MEKIKWISWCTELAKFQRTICYVLFLTLSWLTFHEQEPSPYISWNIYIIHLLIIRTYFFRFSVKILSEYVSSSRQMRVVVWLNEKSRYDLLQTFFHIGTVALTRLISHSVAAMASLRCGELVTIMMDVSPTSTSLKITLFLFKTVFFSCPIRWIIAIRRIVGNNLLTSSHNRLISA